MQRRALLIALCAFISNVSLHAAARAAPSDDFDEAIRLDLRGDSRGAFSRYLRAALNGLPQAQFNVAAMLDSGRGVKRNVAESALWYARSAAHGNRRAAYNLGQLYESGEGVPQNSQVAHAWFAASALPAASTRRYENPGSTSQDAVVLVAPSLLSPLDGSRISMEDGGVVLIWTSQAQPGPVIFYVEIRSLKQSDSREVFTISTEITSVFASLPQEGGSFAWRVTTTSPAKGQYVPSRWFRFVTASDK